MRLDCTDRETIALFVINDRISKSLKQRCSQRTREGRSRHVWDPPKHEMGRRKFISKDKTMRWCRRCGTCASQREIERGEV